MISIDKIQSWCEMHDLKAPVRSRNNRQRWKFTIALTADSDLRPSWERFAQDHRIQRRHGRLPRENLWDSPRYTYQIDWDGQDRTCDVNVLFPVPVIR